MSYEPYNEATASPEDKIAWGLCQLIDDDAPLNWTRYRSTAKSIATNAVMLDSLMTLSFEHHDKVQVKSSRVIL